MPCGCRSCCSHRRLAKKFQPSWPQKRPLSRGQMAHSDVYTLGGMLVVCIWPFFAAATCRIVWKGRSGTPFVLPLRAELGSGALPSAVQLFGGVTLMIGFSLAYASFEVRAMGSEGCSALRSSYVGI